MRNVLFSGFLLTLTRSDGGFKSEISEEHTKSKTGVCHAKNTIWSNMIDSAPRVAVTLSHIGR